MTRLTFEFPTPCHAETFAQESLESSVRHHRVVEVETNFGDVSRFRDERLPSKGFTL